MKPALGWTLLSREALKRAETQLRDDLEGVRDEIGFLAIHQLYADRFFPGTSVLHTRLRYALFVPWLYRRLRDSQRRGQFAAALEREEIALAGRLNMSGEKGVIGGRSYPKPTTQPASMVYWTALGTWGILRPLPSGSSPARSSVHRVLGHSSPSSRLRDDDHRFLDQSDPMFASVPSPPPEWDDLSQRLDFKLRPEERRFVSGRLLDVRRPNSNGKPSLLACLVETRLTKSTDIWSDEVFGAADPGDQDALLRALQAAALAGVGRAVYGALVETMREEDGLPTEEKHRWHLGDAIEDFGGAAIEIDADALRSDAPVGINESILTVLRETQTWLRQRKRDVRDLHSTYERAELRRKGRRARLVRSIAGREKRAEWLPEDHTLAEPLHYRWHNIRRLLLDLQEAE